MRSVVKLTLLGLLFEVSLQLVISLLDENTDDNRGKEQDARDNQDDNKGRKRFLWLPDGLGRDIPVNFAVWTIKANVAFSSIVESYIVALQELIAELVSSFACILRLSENVELADFDSGCFIFVEHSISGIVLLLVDEEPLCVVIGNVRCSIKVKIYILQVLLL